MSWGDGTIIDLQLANKCFKDVFEITKLNAINGNFLLYFDTFQKFDIAKGKILVNSITQT